MGFFGDSGFPSVILVKKSLKALCLSSKMVHQHLLYLLSLWIYWHLMFTQGPTHFFNGNFRGCQIDNFTSGLQWAKTAVYSYMTFFEPQWKNGKPFLKRLFWPPKLCCAVLWKDKCPWKLTTLIKAHFYLFIWMSAPGLPLARPPFCSRLSLHSRATWGDNNSYGENFGCGWKPF